MKTKLQAKIAGLNTVNAEANRIQAICAENFRPYVGKKVMKAGNELLEKFKSLVPHTNLQMWPIRSEYSLGFNIRASVNDANGHTQYSESAFYVGHIRNGILENITQHELRRTDYDEQTIIEQRKIVEAARETLRAAESALSPFETFDR